MTGRVLPGALSRAIHPVIRRMGGLAPLSDTEVALLERLGERRLRYRPSQELIGAGQTARRPRFILSGWAATQRVLTDGRRQILSLVLPGDGLGLCARQAPPALCSSLAITALETVDAEPVLEAVEAGRAPGIAAGLAAAARLDDMLAIDQITRLGSQTAYERVAHLMLELQHRLALAGLGDARRFPMPLTQEVLADILGLSIVHINRTLQQLRREKLIELRSGVAALLDRDMLMRIADFRWDESMQLVTAAPASVVRLPPPAS